MIKQSLPAVSQVTSETFESVKALDKIVVVAYLKEGDKPSNETYTSIAEALRDEYLFAGTNDVVLAEAEGVAQPAIVLYKDFDDGKDIFKGKFEKEEITSFIKSASTPLVGEVGPETYSGYMAVSFHWPPRLHCSCQLKLLQSSLGRDSARLYLCRITRRTGAVRNGSQTTC